MLHNSSHGRALSTQRHLASCGTPCAAGAVRGVRIDDTRTIAARWPCPRSFAGHVPDISWLREHSGSRHPRACTQDRLQQSGTGGRGSGGYNAALLRELVGPSGSVTTVDIDSDVTDRATACLTAAG